MSKSGLELAELVFNPSKCVHNFAE